MSTTVDPRARTAGVAAPTFGRFFLPGPTEVRADVIAAMTRPMIAHRGTEIESLLERVGPRLQQVFRTAQPVYTATSSATGLMEAGVRNAVRTRLLSLVNGAFSARFHKAAVNSGIAADKLEIQPGGMHTPDMLADALRRGQYDAVTVVHSETSTGVLNPIRELTEVAHAAGDVVMIKGSLGTRMAPLVEAMVARFGPGRPGG